VTATKQGWVLALMPTALFVCSNRVEGMRGILVLLLVAAAAAQGNGTSPDGLSATNNFVETDDDNGIGRIPMTFLFASLVALVAIVTALLDRCYPPDQVVPRKFTLTEAERTALMPPMTRYSNIAKPGQVAISVAAAPTTPMVARASASSTAAKPTSSQRDPLLESLLAAPVRVNAVASVSTPSRPVLPLAKVGVPKAPAAAKPKPPVNDPFMDLDIL
jgi:hypothetical protein